jgi:hypothetical protein
MSLNTKTYQPLQSLSVEAAEYIPAFRFISVSGTLCGDNTRALGVSEVEWVPGQFAQAVSLGTITVEASAAINQGDDITSAAEGKARKANTGEKVNGRALDSASAGGFVKIKLVP